MSLSLLVQRGKHTIALNPLIPPLQPFTPTTLKRVRSILEQISSLEAPVDRSSTIKARNAAVLIPFCNVGGEPGILLELRAMTLRNHSGEISFPGGHIDGGESYLDAALRETQEELGIDPNHVEILGTLGPPEYTTQGDTLVWPYVGFIHGSRESRATADEPLPSLDISTIRQNASPDEVAAVIHLPLQTFTSPTRFRQSRFRGYRPYWPVDVTDIVQAAIKDDEMLKVGLLDSSRIEVWGLTGWYLTMLMKALHIYQSHGTYP